MIDKTCGAQDINLRLTVTDADGNVSTNQTVKTITVQPPLVTSFSHVVSTDSTTGSVQYNGSSSETGSTHKWVFGIYLNGGLVATETLDYAAEGAAVNVTGTFTGGSYTISGIAEAPLIEVTGSGTYTINDTHSVKLGGVTCEEAERSTGYTVTGGTDASCAGVIPPLPRTLASLPTVEIVGTTGVIEWVNLVDTPTCTETTITTVTNISSNSATAVWGTQVGASSYNVRYRKSTDTNWINVNGVGGSSHTMSGLTSSSNYEVQVQVDCGSGFASEWSDVYGFTTIASTGTTITGGLRLSSNVFFNTPMDNMDGMHEVRVYADMVNFGNDPDNPVFIEGFDNMDADAYIDSLNAMGIKPLICLQGAGSFIPHPDGYNSEFPAVNNLGDDVTVGANYSKTATMIANIAAHWEGKISGVQCWNEYEAWWDNSGAGDWGVVPFCTFMKECYDTIKAVTTEVDVWWGGLVKFDTARWTELKSWCDTYNGGEIPCDKFAFHCYWSWEASHFDSFKKVISYNGAEAPEFGSTETFSTPAFGNFFEFCENALNIMTDATTGFPSLVGNIWCTEVGYDFYLDGSQHIAQPIGNKSIQEVGMEWLLRSYTALYAAGVAGIHQYMIKNCYGNFDGPLFCLSGLTNGNDSRDKLEQWYWHMTYTKMLEGTNFEGVRAAVDQPIAAYQFTDGTSRIYHLWSPTKDDTVITDYPFSLASDEVNPQIVTPNGTTVDGDIVSLTKDTVNSNVVIPTISERMRFLKVDIV